MREILFRGKSENDGQWVEGSLVITTIEPADDAPIKHYHIEDMTIGAFPNEFQSGLSETVDPATVGQFTGMTDKDGRKAFEHDVIMHHFSYAVGVIKYGEYRNPWGDDSYTGHVGFYVDWVTGEEHKFLRKDLGYWLKTTQIVGNIHDNPELLEVSNDGQ